MKNSIKVLIVVIVAIILIGTAFLVLYHPTEQFTDTSPTCAPEQLDPATGFFIVNGPLFAALFNGLVEFNGSSNNVVPVLASNYTVVNDQNYTFDIRSYANFSNGQQLNASSVWFSLERGILMGQGPFSSDYLGILFNGTAYSNIGIALPNGTIPALRSAGYVITGNTSQEYTTAAVDLDNILSHFNYNATEMKVMEYPHQALVVNTNGTFTINSEHEYAYLLQDMAGDWGDIVEPSYVDAHGGVQVNTPNSYIDANGAIGSGPYVISSVGKGFSTIVIKANPNYWVTSAMVKNGSISVMAEPASIKTIVIDYGLSHADRLEDFDKGISQISTIGPSSFKEMINGFYDKAERTSSLARSYECAGVSYISMNVAYNYTDNTHFREALYDALNYSAELEVYDNNYNGTPEAYAELGPISPMFGNSFYNPDNLPMPTQDIGSAEQNLTLAGDSMHFYVVLPNDTKLGDISGKDLSSHKFVLTGGSPATSLETAQLSAAIISFAQIGLKFTTTLVTESTVDGYTTNTSSPQFSLGAWYPGYPDPIGLQLIDLYDPLFGGAFGGNGAWVNNATLNTYFKTIDYENKTTQERLMKDNISKLVYDQYAYMWLPMPDAVYFVAPGVHGFVYNIATSYYYNMMTFTGKLTSSTGYMTLYTIVADIEIAFTNAAPKF